ncbi:MAG: PAS domain-containing protein [Bacteroidales bacterium]|nr:PAS domain-containing protein [Bacteroidales bacterium]
MTKNVDILTNEPMDYQNLYTPMFTYADKIIWANEAALHFLDADNLGEVAGRRFEDFAPGIQPDGQSVTAKIDFALSAATSSELGNIRLQFFTALGRYKYAEVTVMKLPEKFLFVFHDVTSYMERELELRYRINRLERAIATGSDSVFQLNTDLRTFYFFPSLYKLLGYSTNKSSMMIEDFVALVNENDRPIIRSVYAEFLTPSFRERNDEIRLRNANGQDIWFWFRGTIETLGTNGMPLVISGTVTNVQVRKESEKHLLDKTAQLQKVNKKLAEVNKQLRISEEKLTKQYNVLQALLQNVPVGIYMIELKTRNMLGVNNKAMEILAYDNEVPQSIDQNTHKHWFKAKTNIEYPTEQLPIVKALQTGRYAEIRDLEVEKSTGQRISVFMAAVPVHDSRNNVFAGLVSVFDITETVHQNDLIKEQNYQYQSLNEELRMANAELMQATKRAEESDRLKTSFLENLSHEFRTPMNGIIGFTDLLRDDDVDESDKLLYIDIIRNSAKQLLGIISDIVEISKIDTGQISARMNDVNVYKTALEVYKIIQKQAEQNKDIVFDFICATEVRDIVIVSDEVKLKQVFTNLLNNALKYTKRGYVRVRLSQESGTIVFSVEDTGCGIIPENIPLIFRRFVRLNNSDTIGTTNGAGLGLAIAKSYVELLGGTIDVKSEYGKGSVFTVRLPMKG